MVKSIFGSAIEISDDNGITTFYIDHYMKVRRALGDDIIKKSRYNGEQNGFVKNHELAPTLGQGKKIIFPDGKIRFVDSVYKHWDMGYYYMILYYDFTDRGQRSHGTLYYKNENSHRDYVLEFISEREDVMFLDSSIDEKINIIVENRKKLNKHTIIHINELDAKNIDTIDIDNDFHIKNNLKTIDMIIQEHIDNDKVLLLSGDMNKISKYDVIYFDRNHE
jgi:hypothetical protein